MLLPSPCQVTTYPKKINEGTLEIKSIGKAGDQTSLNTVSSRSQLQTNQDQPFQVKLKELEQQIKRAEEEKKKFKAEYKKQMAQSALSWNSINDKNAEIKRLRVIHSQMKSMQNTE